MKIIAIGDIHGRTCWEQVLNENLDEIKRIVFIGDYFDTHYDITQDAQIENFKKILEFKKANIEKVILLIGNHDFHYMGDFSTTYSGFDATRAFDIRELLNGALKDGLLKASHMEQSEHIPILFTHAGVTETWADNNLPGWNIETISEMINELFIYQPKKFEFTPGDHYNMYGDEPCQTPIWVRPDSLIMDELSDEILQVVGHTQQREISVRGKYIFIDALEYHPTDFLALT